MTGMGRREGGREGGREKGKEGGPRHTSPTLGVFSGGLFPRPQPLGRRVRDGKRANG